MAADDGRGAVKPPSIGAAEPLAAPARVEKVNPKAAREAGAMLAGDDETRKAEELAAQCDERIRGNTWGASRAAPWGTFGAELLGRIDARADGRERAVPTPWPSVNAALGGGLWPGFHVIVGATATGKSQLAMGMGLHAAKGTPAMPDSPAIPQVPVMYLALELDAFGLTCRAVATLARGKDRPAGEPPPPQWSDLYTGKARPPAWAAARLGELPFHWVEAPPFGMPYDAILPHVEAMTRHHKARGYTGPVMVIVDFLQLVASPDNRREDLRERIGRAAYQCRAIARDCNAVVVALSSTARQDKKDNPLVVRVKDGVREPLPMPHDLVGLGKESGDVEFSADSVMVLCRDAWPEGEPPSDGPRVHLAVAKLRAGVPSWCSLAFDGTTFADPDPPQDGAAAPIELPSRGRGNGKGRGKTEKPPPDRRLPDNEKESE